MENSKLPQGSAGGQVMAIKLRAEALSKYYKNPNVCLECQQTITVADHQRIPDVRSKKFCNKTCSGRFNLRTRRATGFVATPRSRSFNPCADCGDLIIRDDRSVRKFCTLCWNAKSLAFKSKSESSHSEIRGHARAIAKTLDQTCKCCGYAKHIEVCHITPVAAFNDSSLLSEINKLSNLVILCRNHHWEFDHNLLDAEDLAKITKGT